MFKEKLRFFSWKFPRNFVHPHSNKRLRNGELTKSPIDSRKTSWLVGLSILVWTSLQSPAQCLYAPRRYKSPNNVCRRGFTSSSSLAICLPWRRDLFSIYLDVRMELNQFNWWGCCAELPCLQCLFVSPFRELSVDVWSAQGHSADHKANNWAK